MLTPMVRRNFEVVPGLKEKWEREDMLGRLADTYESKGAALFNVLDERRKHVYDGKHLIIDSCQTSW